MQALGFGDVVAVVKPSVRAVKRDLTDWANMMS